MKIAINPLEELLKGIEVVYGIDYSNFLRRLIRIWSQKQIESLENVNGDGI